MFNLKDFLTETLLNILECTKTSYKFEKYDVKRNIFQNFFDEKQNRLFLPTKAAVVLSLFVTDEIEENENKKKKIFKYFNNFLTDDEKIYIANNPEDIDSIINFTIIKFLRKSNTSFDDYKLENKLKNINGNEFIKSLILEIQPVRIIPFDLGVSLNSNYVKSINELLSKEYKEIMFTSRRNKLLCNSPIAFKINDFLELSICETGIGTFIIKEKAYKEYRLRYFSIDYCERRKITHLDILNWNHEQSKCMKKVIKLLKDFVLKNNENIRLTARDSFEHEGLSYVMTIVFLKCIGGRKQVFNWNTTPNWLKRNIAVLLNPSIIFKEDSINFSNELSINVKFEDIIDNIDIESEYRDYENRFNLSTYASWASVLSIGSMNKCDIEDYTMLEIKIQQKWFYIYCLEKLLPKGLNDFEEENLNLKKLKLKKYELDILENQLFHIDDSSFPERILNIQKGIIETCKIMNLINRYRQKLNSFIELVQLKE
jgi:hypothetical protein